MADGTWWALGAIAAVGAVSLLSRRGSRSGLDGAYFERLRAHYEETTPDGWEANQDPSSEEVVYYGPDVQLHVKPGGRQPGKLRIGIFLADEGASQSHTVDIEWSGDIHDDVDEWRRVMAEVATEKMPRITPATYPTVVRHHRKGWKNATTMTAPAMK